MDTAFKKVRLLFHKVSVGINTLFPLLLGTLYAGRVEHFAEASEFFKHAVFGLVREMVSSECSVLGL